MPSNHMDPNINNSCHQKDQKIKISKQIQYSSQKFNSFIHTSPILWLLGANLEHKIYRVKLHWRLYSNWITRFNTPINGRVHDSEL